MMNVTLTNYTQNPTLAIEQAASNCYDSCPTEDGKIMNACYNSGHQSVLEFAVFTFHVEGVSRSLLAQLTRHRIGVSYAVRSQRYNDESIPKYVTPDKIKNNPTALAFYEDIMDRIWHTYKVLQDAGIPNEDARYILPNACETTLEVQFTGRALIHFCNERLCNCAQSEIRELALKIREELNKREDCREFAKFLVPKCEAGKVKYCNEPPKRSCGRQPLAKELNEIINK